MIIVADSSPLISLAILQKLDILNDLFDNVYIPDAVFKEISAPKKPFSDSLTRFQRQE